MAASFIDKLLGRRSKKDDYRPNISDSGSDVSIAISNSILEMLGLPSEQFVAAGNRGALLEQEVAADLDARMPHSDDNRWVVKSKGNPIRSFAQYRHLAALDEEIKKDESGTLRIVVGADYLVKPDVTVGRITDAEPILHASVSCKWTLRSDRAQNARTEARGLLDHRKGRAPHIVLVTAEPLPSRLASLGFGTGDVDALYHVLFPELLDAVDTHGTDKERRDLDVLVRGDRLLDYNDLPAALINS